MFCRFNTQSVPAFLKPAQSMLDTQRLYRCNSPYNLGLGLALKHSLSEFQSQRAVEEKETVKSEKSLLSCKTA